MKITCPYLKNASGLAHKRGLLPKKQKLTCEFEGKCDYVDCQKIERPNYRAMYFRQPETDEILSSLERFKERARKSLRMIRERG